MIIPYTAPPLTGALAQDVARFLLDHGCASTADHSRRVARQAQHLAVTFGSDASQAADAAWLHDVSAVIPGGVRLTWARRWAIAILPVEHRAPVLLHQKLSAWMARHVFGVGDVDVLSAVGCHTTLRGNASLLDKTVFVADKIAWDQRGQPPYGDRLIAALDGSLDAAACVYIDYLWSNRDALVAVHPWLEDARRQLC